LALCFVLTSKNVHPQKNQGAPIIPNVRIAEFSADVTRAYRGDLAIITAREGFENQVFPFENIRNTRGTWKPMNSRNTPEFIGKLENIVDSFAFTEVATKVTNQTLALHAIITQTGALCGTVDLMRKGFSKYQVCNGLEESPGVSKKLNDTLGYWFQGLPIIEYNQLIQGTSLPDTRLKRIRIYSSPDDDDLVRYDEETKEWIVVEKQRNGSVKVVRSKARPNKRLDLIDSAINIGKSFIDLPGILDLTNQPLSFFFDVIGDITLRNIYEFVFNTIKTAASVAGLRPGDFINKNAFCSNTVIVIDLLKSVCADNRGKCTGKPVSDECPAEFEKPCGSRLFDLSTDLIIESCKVVAPRYLEKSAVSSILTSVVSPAVDLLKNFGILRNGVLNNDQKFFFEADRRLGSNGAYRFENSVCACPAQYNPLDEVLCDVRTGSLLPSACTPTSCNPQSTQQIPPQFVGIRDDNAPNRCKLV